MGKLSVETRTKLRQNLTQYFSEEELKTLAVDLDIDYENLPGSNKEGKARELIAHLEHLDTIDRLRSIGKVSRPSLNWDLHFDSSKMTGASSDIKNNSFTGTYQSINEMGPSLSFRWRSCVVYIGVLSILLTLTVVVASYINAGLTAFLAKPTPAPTIIPRVALATSLSQVTTTSRLPDLVGAISISPSKSSFTAGEPVEISVVVKNQGLVSSGQFYVDLFINPSSIPTGTNQTWDSKCSLALCFGIAWYVPNIQPGQAITLTSNKASYARQQTRWPGWFASGTTDLYLFVDSYNPASTWGAVLESDEKNNLFHLGGLKVTGEDPVELTPTPTSTEPTSVFSPTPLTNTPVPTLPLPKH